MDRRPLSCMSAEEIKKAVGDKYGRVARDPCAKFNFPVGRAYALKVGYPEDILDALPESMSDSFTGANNPQPLIELREGETVLDLGCGAGLDLYFYAKKAGVHTTVYGADISGEMVEKARKNLDLAGVRNVKIKCSHSDALPFEDNCFDVVASNGIYNLSPDKEKVMREVFRVLKPGGRTVFCEIVLKKRLPENTKKSIDDWFRCIGGALPRKEFLALMVKAGFKKIEIISEVRNARTGHRLAVCANVRARKLPGRLL